MRVLYFYQYFTTPRGSWSTRVYEFGRRWVAAGHEVVVVTSVYDKSDLRPRGLLDRMQVDGIDVRVVNVRLSNKHGYVVRVLSFLAYALLGSWYALTVRADVVVASSGPITVGIPGLVARYLRRRPLVFEVRDLWPEGAIQLGKLRSPVLTRVARWLEGVCYRAAHAVVALSEGMRDDIVRRHPGSEVAVVPNSADLELFGEPAPAEVLPAWTADVPYVVYTGTFGLMDDCSQILDAAEELGRRGSEVRFVLIGDGAEGAALRDRVGRTGLGNVAMPGLMPKESLVPWLQRAVAALIVFRDVPVLGTVSPNKMFDAFAAGVPVVQNTRGWIADLVAREGCGVNVPPNDPMTMADAVAALAGDPARRDRLAANAARVARERFERGVLADSMLEVLEAAASSPRYGA